MGINSRKIRFQIRKVRIFQDYQETRTKIERIEKNENIKDTELGRGRGDFWCGE